MAAIKKNIGIYNDLPYESLEELYFLKWAKELQNIGVIKTIERCKSYSLCDKRTIQYVKSKQLKKSVQASLKEHLLTREHSYTPDYCITFNLLNNEFIWNEKNPDFNKPFFYNSFKDGFPIVYIEIKPKFDQNGMCRLFKISQKWMYEKYKIFVNLIIPEYLFEQTFTPGECLFTPTGKTKKISYKIKTLNEFLNIDN